MPNVSEVISQILLKKLREEQLTRQEAATLAEWEGRSPEHAEFIAMLMDEASMSDKIRDMLELDEQSAWQRIELALSAEWNDRPATQKKKRSWYKYAAAASVVILLGFGIYFFLVSKPTASEASKATKPTTIAGITPGGNRALLTLADGAVINLDTVKEGRVAMQGGHEVIKKEDGQLVYTAAGDNSSESNLYNTLQTPRGGTYQLTLPDGSRVWLNSSSYIRYPVLFSGPERRVEIRGEVYFEVTHHPGVPFIAEIAGSLPQKEAVRVIGTEFNINTYDADSARKVTLVKGRVEVISADKTFRIKPSQQAVLSGKAGQRIINVENVENLDRIISWKEGFFAFNRESLTTIMKGLERWYDIDEVIFVDKVDEEFSVPNIRRDMPVSDVLHMIEATGKVRFRIEGKKIFVTK